MIPRTIRVIRIASATASAIAVALVVATGGLAASAVPANAQTDVDDRARGVVAYRSMDYETALRWLRQDLARRRAAMRPAERAELLAYVAASHHWLNRPDSARAAFRLALAASPSFRLDTLTFPADIWSTFERVRAGTSFLDARIAREASFAPGRGGAGIVLHSSAPQRVHVALCDPADAPVATVHDGWIEDSLTVVWRGTRDDGRELVGGRYSLCRVDGEGGVRDGPDRLALLDLSVTPGGPSAPPVNAPAVVGPGDVAATAALARARRSARIGTVAAALMVSLLPPLVSEQADGNSVRFAVGGAILATAFYGGRRTRGVAGTPAVERAPVTRTETRVTVRPARTQDTEAPDDPER